MARLFKVHLAGFLVVLLIHVQVEGSTYVVGDRDGWNFLISNSTWAQGIRFQAGDILVFNYIPGFHNVVEVDEKGYRSCNGGKVRPFTSGHDTIALKKGYNYFICGFPGHCDLAGMKISIKAE